MVEDIFSMVYVFSGNILLVSDLLKFEIEIIVCIVQYMLKDCIFLDWELFIVDYSNIWEFIVKVIFGFDNFNV